MKIAIFSLSLILCASLIVLSRTQNNLFAETLIYNFDEILKFDQYRQLSMNDEKARLENLLISLNADKKAHALILFRLSKNDSKKKKRKRFRAISNCFERGKLDVSRLNLVFLESEQEDTVIYLQPQDVNLMDFLYFENSNYKIIKAENLKLEINELFTKK